MAVYHINNQLQAMGDVQRTYGFNVIIDPPKGIGPAADAFKETGIIFSLIRDVNIPGRENIPIESFFHAMKQKFPGREEFSGAFSITVEESGNLDALRALYEWKQKIFNVNQGVSNTLIKKDIVGVGYIKFLDYAEKELPGYVKVFNIWPKSMPDINMSYQNGGESVKYQITFEYDYWTLEGDTGTFSPGATY